MSPEDIPLLTRNAERGSDASQVLLATAYLDGDGGLVVDPVRAAHWFEVAALQGNGYAQERIADLYQSGHGVKANPVLAFDWMMKAAQRGNLQAQIKLARMYQQGLGTTKNPAQSRYWLERAATEGNAEAQYLIGKMDHATATSRPEELQALSWLEKAAKQGYDRAIKLIGELKSLGYGANEEWHHRLPQIQKLAADGDPEAEFQLAQRYEHGAGGFEKNAREALRWYERSATNGNRPAMLALSHIYAQGLGVAPDPGQARKWADRANAIKQ